MAQQQPQEENSMEPPSTAIPKDSVDYRDDQGPSLRYLWCRNGDDEEQDDGAKCDKKKLTGQSLYLGAELGSDNHMYCVPGHAVQVLKVDTNNNTVSRIGPIFLGKFKWLRAVRVGDTLYGLPCHARAVLRIHVTSGRVDTIPIPYSEHYHENEEEAEQHRSQEWKYHGGTISPVDGCIYCIPQSALHVLKIDPATDTCILVGPPLPGRYKWYGGVVSRTDGAIYGIPHNASSVLRIHPTAGITLHGDFGDGGHKWHGAAAAGDGTIVSVPANIDSVLCITPAKEAIGEPVLTLLVGNGTTTIKTGRHRNDGKYKYLGATTGPDGCVYCFPSGSEQVLKIDAARSLVETIGPNLYDCQMERMCQNKWQNGLVVGDCVYGIPLAAKSVLCINTVTQQVTTWPLPHPTKGLAKWEGGLVCNRVMYTVPNNHKAVLRIEPFQQSTEGEIVTNTASAVELTPSVNTAPRESALHAIDPTQSNGPPEEGEELAYRSGIPTLRSSAHRVKHAYRKSQTLPKPINSKGKRTNTLWLPPDVLRENVFAYDQSRYDLTGALVSLLKRCDPDMVGTFHDDSDKLEAFQVPSPSTWRKVNGGQCEVAQKYLSDAVAADETFLAIFDKLVQEVVVSYMKDRLVKAGAVDEEDILTFYYQRPPTLRFQPGPAWAQVKAHHDAIYGHQNGELNFWLPLTDRELTKVDLLCESEANLGDFHPLPAKPGEMVSFHGTSCRHFLNCNTTPHTRVSMDFRVGVQGFFDPYWQMGGTTDDHGRHEAKA